MRRIISVIAVLAAVVAMGCSRQPPPHVGEWSGESFMVGDEVMYRADIVFLPDGKVQKIRGAIEKQPLRNIVSGGSPVQEGKYKFDYNKDPIQLDINWDDNTAMRGIVRYVGEDKNRMQIMSASYSPDRPRNFDAKEPFWWLTKKVKK